ncbi:hypothetical protein K1719_019926 [Acacia pycnantha]|nr:hypothetical protein K1719_019926 [Acacia pycnantha]
MDPNQQRARPRTQTSSFMLRFFLPFIAIMSAMVVYRLHKEYVHETLLNHELDYNKTLIHDKIHHHINQVVYQLHKEYVRETLLNHELDYNKTLIHDKIHHHINQVVYWLHKEYVRETFLNHELDYNKTLIHDKIHHHINKVYTSHSLQQVYIDDFLKVVYWLHKEYVHETLLNHELDYNKTLIHDKIHHHINQVVYWLHVEYVRETFLNHELDYNKTLIHDKIHHHINKVCASHSLQQDYIDDFLTVVYQLHKEYVRETLLNHELDYNKTLIHDKIHHHINQVVYRLHKEYVRETLLNHELDYNKTLIHDKIHHHINKISEEMKEAFQPDCKRYAPGIEIIGVHVTKPAIPDSIRRYFKQLEEERIKVLVAVERQKVAEKEAETSKKMAISEAKKNVKVSKILMEQTLLENEGSKSQQEIENQMYLQRKRGWAYVSFRATKEAEANNRLKLALKFIKAFVEIAKRSSGMMSFSPGYFSVCSS